MLGILKGPDSKGILSPRELKPKGEAAWGKPVPQTEARGRLVPLSSPWGGACKAEG